jgi:glycosyltransferase involved in cell wall biosynthesis
MRVLVLSSVYPTPTIPTRGLFVRERTRHLAKLCQMHVVAPIPWFPFNRLFRGFDRDAAPRFEVRDELSVHHPRYLSVPGTLKSLDGVLYFVSLLPFISRLRRDFPFELIDAHFAYPDGLAALLMARRFGVPVTVTLRGTEVPLSRRRLRRLQIRTVLRGANRVIAVSQSLANLALALGAPDERVRVIPNGIDGACFRPGSRHESRVALGLPADRRLLVSVGGLTERKGHHRILEVLPELLQDYPDLLFVVVGGPTVEGDTGSLLRSTIARLGLDAHARLAGSCSHEQVATWLQAADLFCLATENEGRPNAVIEALACGVPVVTTNVGGNSEIVRSGEDGLLVSFGDPRALVEALRVSLRTAWERDALSIRARERTWDQTAAQVMTEFRAVRGCRPSGDTAAVEHPVEGTP